MPEGSGEATGEYRLNVDEAAPVGDEARDASVKVVGTDGAPWLGEGAQPGDDAFIALVAALGLATKEEIAQIAAASGPVADLPSLLVRRRVVMPQTLAALGLEAFEREGFESDFVLVDPDVMRDYDLARAARARFLPIARTGDALHIAVADYLHAGRIREIRQCLPREVKLAPELWPQAELRDAFEMAFDGRFQLDTALKDIAGNAPGRAGDAAPGSERPRRTPPVRPAFELKPKRFQRSVIAEGPRRMWSEDGVRILNALIVMMLARSSGMVRIDADQGAVSVRWRVDGLMRRGRTISERQARALFEILEMMGAGESPFQVRLGRRCASVSLVCAPGEHDRGSLEMKLLRQAPPSLAALGLSEANVRLARRLLARPRGLILIAAPAGHGKTRTLGSFARAVAPQRRLTGLATRAAEIELGDVTTAIARGDEAMAAAICDFMTLQADVLLVDEPAGLAAWRAAIDAAQSGALVVATLRAPSAAAAIARLVALGIAPGDLALALQGIVAQNLVPRLCPACAAHHEARAAEKRVLGASADAPLALSDAQGCEACGGTGRKGRVVIAEVMLSDPVMEKLIAAQGSRADLMAAARARGTVSLAGDAIARVKAGEIALMDLVQSVDLSAEGLPV